jgi:hypothetical protein
MSLEAIHRAYVLATGNWTGCDWSVQCGESGLDLRGRTANEAQFWAEMPGSATAQDWRLAADWLGDVELKCAEARGEGEAALAAAREGKLREAMHHAQQACWLEQSAGRTAVRPPAWAPLCHAIATTIEENGQALALSPTRVESTSELLDCIRILRTELDRQQRALFALQCQAQEQAAKLTSLESKATGESIGANVVEASP